MDTDDFEPPVQTYQGQGNTLDDRLSQEEPETDAPRTDIPYDRSLGGVGQIVADPDDDGPEDLPGEQQSVFARAEGGPRRDASPEESAMHFSDGYDEADLFGNDGHDENESDEEDDDIVRRDDSAAEFAFDEDEEDELA